MINPEQLIANLPYGKEFLFAEKILSVDKNKIIGQCFFPATHPYYQGHFKDKLILPGVFIVEGIGQVALVAHALWLDEELDGFFPVLHQISAEFHQKVPVDQSLKVIGELIYFRHRTIKSNMLLFNAQGDLLVYATGLAKLVKPEFL